MSPAARRRGGPYLSGAAVFGVGTPAALIATTSVKIVCASLVPKYRVPEVPGATGAADEK